MQTTLALWFFCNFVVGGSGTIKHTHGRSRNPSVGCTSIVSNLLLAKQSNLRLYVGVERRLPLMHFFYG